MKSKDNNHNEGSLDVDHNATQTGANSSATQPLKTEDDKREHNIDASKSISEMREDAENAKGDRLSGKPGDQNSGLEDDAMNYKSDRENSASNAKHS